MWGLYLGYSNNTVQHTYVSWQGYLFGTYDNNVKSMYTSDFAHNIDCIEFK